jgi:hypothetical protein
MVLRHDPFPVVLEGFTPTRLINKNSHPYSIFIQLLHNKNTSSIHIYFPSETTLIPIKPGHIQGSNKIQ